MRATAPRLERQQSRYSYRLTRRGPSPGSPYSNRAARRSLPLAVERRRRAIALRAVRVEMEPVPVNFADVRAF